MGQLQPEDRDPTRALEEDGLAGNDLPVFDQGRARPSTRRKATSHLLRRTVVLDTLRRPTTSPFMEVKSSWPPMVFNATGWFPRFPARVFIPFSRRMLQT